MKHQMKRGVSMLLALVLIVSLFSGLTIPVQAADYTYNWGQRGQTATSLSSAAQAFYAAKGTSYEVLASNTGSSELGKVPSSTLYNALYNLMAGSHTHQTSYDETKDLYRYTDCQNGGGAISSFYSGTAIGPDWDGTWNREHTWPNSKGLNANDENDIMMLRPTTTTENSGRGNTAYGSSSGYYDPNGESGGTYNLHGDVARIMLYVYTRWGNIDNMWGKDGVMESKSVLLSWMQEDPVDTWEMGRNDAVQSITGTRNVFVDYPELAFLLFGESIPTNMTTPSGKAGETYTITATVNDDSMGSVSLSGSNINAVPAEGYRVSGYEIVSGTAEVIQSGNAFSVRATSDCTIRINFEAKTPVTLTYMDNGAELSSEELLAGDIVALPAYTGTAPEGYTFLGWSDATVSHTDAIPAYYESETSYTVSEDTTLYALFSYVASTGGAGVWTLVTDASQLSAGDHIVLASQEKGVVSAPIPSGKTYMDKEPATFSGNTIPTLPDGAQTFTLGGSAGAWTLSNEDGQLLGATANKKIAFGKGTTTWSIFISDGDATIQNGTSSYGSFRYNTGSPRFTTYTSAVSSTMLLPQIYMRSSDAPTTYYTTESCVHANTEEAAAQSATCTTDGYTAGVYCHDCGNYISGHEKIAATGHSYTAVVTPPTATEDGYTTYTCPACGDSYTGDIVPALGETYTVSFSVPVDAADVADMSCNNSGITLPEAEVPATDGVSYTFLGWTTQTVDNSTEKPEYYEAGTTYVAPSDITLYALYTRVDGGTGESAYVLVETMDQLTAGSKIVIASSQQEVALGTTQNGNNRSQATITKNDDKTITLGSGVAELTLGEGTVDGTWSFYCSDNGGYLYAASSSKNYLRTKAALDANGSFAIELGENGAASVIAQGSNTRNQLRYNKGNSIFACYGSGQIPVCFYIETTSGTTYYTTEIAHVHSGIYQAEVPASCETDGVKAHYLCACGQKYADESCTQPVSAEALAIPAAHPGMEPVAAVPPTCTETGLTEGQKCSVCGEILVAQEEIPALGHTWNETAQEIVPPTCTEKGCRIHKCLYCDETITYEDAEATGHTLDEGVITKEPTCIEKGVKTYSCTAEGCDYTETESVDTVDHSLDDGTVTKEATCEEKGKMTYACTVEGCDHTETLDIAALGHDWGAWKVTAKATCTKKGTEMRTCENDASHTETRRTDKLDHEFEDGECVVCGIDEESADTGDSFPMVMLLVLMAASAWGLYVLTAMPGKKGRFSR